jgi:hypothetical protein
MALASGEEGGYEELVLCLATLVLVLAVIVGQLLGNIGKALSFQTA